ncbi:MAG TPA: hypothetical protein VGZ49_15885 [Xanthobacteraceae bacterium]|jgi:hypothetical protein|nr:hypothetical protein [Xanthobacteraceae bacterium]
MNRLIILGLLLVSCFAAADADDTQSWMERFKNTAGDYLTMPSLSIPSMPDLSMPDFSKMGDGMMSEFTAFTKQVAETLPLLEEMGYEVSTFRVQWGLPPKAKLRLRSIAGTSSDKIAAVVARPTQGVLMASLVSSAAEAKRIQHAMKFGTAVIDVDFALPPKVKMSFMKQQGEAPDIKMEDLDLTCAQALN